MIDPINTNARFWELCRRLYDGKYLRSRREKKPCLRCGALTGEQTRLCNTCHEKAQRLGSLATRQPAKIIWDDDSMQGMAR